MQKSKAKKFKIIPNLDLQTAVKGFVPVFGNPEDRNIVIQLGALQGLLESVDNDILRNGPVKKVTKKMEDIRFKEGGLIHSITRRNMDF